MRTNCLATAWGTRGGGGMQGTAADCRRRSGVPVRSSSSCSHRLCGPAVTLGGRGSSAVAGCSAAAVSRLCMGDGRGVFLWTWEECGVCLAAYRRCSTWLGNKGRGGRGVLARLVCGACNGRMAVHWRMVSRHGDVGAHGVGPSLTGNNITPQPP
jgi:hypothetical protein